MLPIGHSPQLGDQSVTFLAAIDFEKDGSSELAVGTEVFGAGNGPMTVWVLAYENGAMRTDFKRETTRGGTLMRTGADQLTMVTGAYAASDPLCCPSRVETWLIGATGKGVGLLKRTITARPNQ
jgi:hypothetical protein